MEERSMKSFKKQVGGSHYLKYKIPVVTFIHQNKLSFIVGCVIKYLCRYKDKNGLQDLEKAKHYIDLLIEEESTKGRK